MNKIGRKIYYMKRTGEVLHDTGELFGDVIESTYEQDIKMGNLENIPDEEIAVLKLPFGANRDMFQMNEYSFIKVDLKTNNYVSFNRFSEPMYNIDLLKKRVNQAIEIEPGLQYLVNTNGDFLTKESLMGLHLDKLNIMDYDNKGFGYWERKYKEIDVITVEKDVEMGKLVGIHNNIGKVNCEVNWTKHAKIEDRAGYLKEDIRDKDGDILHWRNDRKRRYINCIEPKYYASIDWNGSVMLCCHYRSDNPDHKDMILGNVKTNTLYQILNGEKAEYYKMLLMSDEYDKYPDSCKYCQKLRGIQVREDQNLNRKIGLKEYEE